MSTQVNIPDEVLSILRESRVEGDKLYLPDKHLDNFHSVKKTLGLLRGTWKGGKVSAFVFDRDVTEEMPTIIAAKTFVDEKKEFQFFETQRPEAMRMVERAELQPGMSIKEPHAGRGALARVIRELMPLGCTLCVGEINPLMRTHLEDEGFNVTGDDFLLSRGKFDRLIQNPPFANRQGARHILHGYDYCLNERGRLVSAMCVLRMSDGRWCWPKGKGYERVRSLMSGEPELLPDGCFKESGTTTRAVIVTLDK